MGGCPRRRERGRAWGRSDGGSSCAFLRRGPLIQAPVCVLSFPVPFEGCPPQPAPARPFPSSPSCTNCLSEARSRALSPGAVSDSRRAWALEPLHQLRALRARARASVTAHTSPSQGRQSAQFSVPGTAVGPVSCLSRRARPARVRAVRSARFPSFHLQPESECASRRQRGLLWFSPLFCFDPA